MITSRWLTSAASPWTVTIRWASTVASTARSSAWRASASALVDRLHLREESAAPPEWLLPATEDDVLRALMPERLDHRSPADDHRSLQPVQQSQVERAMENRSSVHHTELI